MKKVFLLVMLVLFGLFSCVDRPRKNPLDPEYQNPNNNNPGQGGTPFQTETKNGRLYPNANSTLALSDLIVNSISRVAQIDNNGAFDIEISKSDNYQLVFVNSNVSEEPVYIGLKSPNDNTISISDTSTAKALTLLTPYLAAASQQLKDDFLNQITNNNNFDGLLDQLSQNHAEHPTQVLNYEQNPLIFQKVAQIVQETLASMDEGGLAKANTFGPAPYLEDVAGQNINFVNPRFIYYAASIQKSGTQQGSPVILEKPESMLSFAWGWPPIVNFTETTTPYQLADGTYSIYITKGNEFGQINDSNDAAGVATTNNLGRAFAYMLDIGAGNLGEFNNDLLSSLPANITITTAQELELNQAFGTEDAQQVVIALSDLMKANAIGVANWLFSAGNNQATVNFIKLAAEYTKQISFAFKLLGYTKNSGPFFVDLIGAPKEVIYDISCQNGNIVTTVENQPPVAEFTVSPPAAIVGVEFTFDASATTDDNDSNLEYRWDFNGDGTWDSSWSPVSSVAYTFTESGSYKTVLEARDSAGLVSQISHTVNVGGGQGSANHIKLFQDALPWSSNAMVNMLEKLGFTEGTGQDQYEILTSDVMGSVSLIPGQDLVIIANDQPQSFYNNYAASQIRFNSFAYGGGAIFWEACDQGWANGSIKEAGIQLPAQVTTDHDYHGNNYVYDPNLPLVAGMPSPMDHNHASHERFVNLPDGTIIYCVDEDEIPTLIEFNFGVGWVLMTGQPLEHQYDNIYGNPDMEQLLPRIVSYFTGKEYVPELAKKSRTLSTRPSSHK